MFLNKFNENQKYNLISLAMIIKNDENLLDNYILEAKINVDKDEILENIKDINALFQIDQNEFKDEIKELCNEINIKFYLEANILLANEPLNEKNLLIKQILKDSLNASEEIFMICENWCINMSYLIMSANKILTK